jgi:hypothetical protein
MSIYINISKIKKFLQIEKLCNCQKKRGVAICRHCILLSIVFNYTKYFIAFESMQSFASVAKVDNNFYFCLLKKWSSCRAQIISQRQIVNYLYSYDN